MKSCEYSCRQEIVKKVGNEYSLHPLSNRSEGIPERKRLLKCRFGCFYQDLRSLPPFYFPCPVPVPRFPQLGLKIWEPVNAEQDVGQCRTQCVLHRSILFLFKMVSILAFCSSLVLLFHQEWSKYFSSGEIYSWNHYRWRSSCWSGFYTSSSPGVSK